MNAHVSPAQEAPKPTAAYEDPALYGGLDELPPFRSRTQMPRMRTRIRSFWS